jgi:hypothetical protein
VRIQISFGSDNTKIDVRMNRDIEKEAGYAGERSGAKAATDDGAGPTVKDQVVGNTGSEKDADEGEAPATEGVASVETTIEEEIKALGHIKDLMDIRYQSDEGVSAENMIGSMHRHNMNYIKGEIITHGFIIRMGSSSVKDAPEESKKRGEIY